MSEKVKKEETYYYDKLRMRLLKHLFRCFTYRKQIGCEDIGNIDLVGIKDVGGWSCGNIEVIGVEVKKAHEGKEAMAHFGKMLGQALGYSLICHRVYLLGLFLPNEKGFTEEQRYLANHLGVGLIETTLSKNGKDVIACRIVQTSIKHKPIEHKLNSLLHHLGIRKCAVCNVYYEKKFGKDYPISEMNLNRNFLFRDQKQKKLWVCKTCQEVFDFRQRKLNLKEAGLYQEIRKRRGLEFKRYKKINNKISELKVGIKKKTINKKIK